MAAFKPDYGWWINGGWWSVTGRADGLARVVADQYLRVNNKTPSDPDIGHGLYAYLFDNIPFAEIFQPQGGTTSPEPEPDDPTAPDPEFPLPSVYRGDFLTAGADTGDRASTLFLLADGAEARLNHYRRAHDREHNCLSFYLYNERDGAWDTKPVRPFNGYSDLTRTKDIVDEVWANTLVPIPWLLPDDAPALHGKLVRQKWYTNWEKIVQRMERLLAEIEFPVIVAGLEMSEYLHPEEMVEWVRHIRGAAPDSKILLHLTSGRMAGSPPRVNKNAGTKIIPDPYGNMPKFWREIRKVAGKNVGLALQLPKEDKEHVEQVIRDTMDRVGHGRKGGFDHSSTAEVWLGEAGKPTWSENEIRDLNRLAARHGIVNSLHAGRK